MSRGDEFLFPQDAPVREVIGGQSFVVGHLREGGLRIREYVAIQIMAGMASDFSLHGTATNPTLVELAEIAVVAANTLLEALEKKP